MQKLENFDEIKEFKTRIQAENKGNDNTPCITMCGGGGCTSLGGTAISDRFIKVIEEKGLKDNIRFKTTGCYGICASGPIVTITPGNIFYQEVNEDDALSIIEETVLNNRAIDKLLFKDSSTGKKIESDNEIPFFTKQKRVVFRNCGKIDPANINEYILDDGYQALEKAIKNMSPEGVVKAIIDSGLRGRGGGGYPTGLKLDCARKTNSDTRYIICNGGAFKDKSILEADPHSIIEGMAIAGYAIGACQGYIYVRSEDTITIQHLKKAIADAETLGLLGENILNKGIIFKIDIKESAGAFVCGEETALISFIEDSRGIPNQKPPYPAVVGLRNKPTIINNVETLANVPLIVLKGADWHKKLGTKKSTGTKLFALEGRIRNTGLVEVPFGTSLREIIDIGGGIPGIRSFKTALIGGPSGGFVSKGFLDTPLEFDTIKAAGAIVGSSSLNIMDEGSCVVEITRLSIAFLQAESCGKCVPCRIGTKRMLEILTRITRGKGKLEDIDLLYELASGIKETALCGLGKTSANPVLTGIKHFRYEYEAHVRDKYCSAAVCEELSSAPCQNRCPADINVPEYVALISKKKHVRALELIRKRNPFSSVCGHICNHPCEILCRRGELDESIAIKDLKRFASDFDLNKRKKAPAKKVTPTGKKVAIIGGGPGGLTAAFFLRQFGHKTVVYEALPVAGGMLTVGIPEFRLQRSAPLDEIEYIKSTGVAIKTDTPIDDENKFSKLLKTHDAVFIAIGAHKGRKMNIPGEDMDGIMDGVTFLRNINLGLPQNVGKNVAVIGAGNVAMDSARTALRMGADKVTVIYRRSREEMPAEDEEISEAMEEGIEFNCLTAPIEVLGRYNKIDGLKCVKMELLAADESGRRRPAPVDGSEFVIRTDMTLLAISQSPDLSFLQNSNVKQTNWGTIITEPGTHRTSDPKVFAGGDCVLGPATAIEAIGDGQKAAAEIDIMLGGKGDLPENTDPIAAKCENKFLEKMEGDQFRPKMPHINLEKRKTSFEEVKLGYSEEDCVQESRRCLRCDLPPD